MQANTELAAFEAFVDCCSRAVSTAALIGETTYLLVKKLSSNRIRMTHIETTGWAHSNTTHPTPTPAEAPLGLSYGVQYMYWLLFKDGEHSCMDEEN